MSESMRLDNGGRIVETEAELKLAGTDPFSVDHEPHGKLHPNICFENNQ